jgi:integrase
MRVHVQRRVYGGKLDTPKGGKSKLIVLTPPARDALLSLPRDGGLVFRSKQGKRLSQATVSGYWNLVLARAELQFNFYLATKHWCVHYLYAELRLEPRVIAQQMGWALGSVLKMLEVYGHGDLGALEAIDRAFDGNVVQLRRVQDADGTA